MPPFWCGVYREIVLQSYGGKITNESIELGSLTQSQGSEECLGTSITNAKETFEEEADWFEKPARTLQRQ